MERAQSGQLVSKREVTLEKKKWTSAVLSGSSIISAYRCVVLGWVLALDKDPVSLEHKIAYIIVY